MKHMKFLGFPILLLTLLFTVASCDKDDPEPENEEELITTLRLEFTPQAGGDQIQMLFFDPDGNGGMDPTIQGATLKPNTVYDVDVTLLNESVTPATDISQEVRDEGEDHQFFFAITEGLDLQSYEYLDFDENSRPIGLEFRVTTGEPSFGLFQVTLRHEPDKGAAGVSQGQITNAGGETDIEVSFNMVIEE